MANYAVNDFTETAVDLALVLSVMSSLRDQPIPPDVVVFGEIGLSGEIRPVSNGQERLREAQKLGFKRALVPQNNVPKKTVSGMTIIGCTTLAAALQALQEF